MAKMRLEEILAGRGPQQPTSSTSRQAERPRAPGERLEPQERKALMLRAAEQLGITMEAEAMLSLVRAVEGFTNMAAVYKVPDRTMIDAERMRGARTEAQARGRAWGRLHERQGELDREMEESGAGYVRPSDWFRLFAALKKATKPGEGVPHVFAAESPKDRSTFRAWAERYGLDGDGLVRVAKMIRADQETKVRGSFDVDAFIEKVQALDAKRLHEVIRAGFETDDIFIRAEEGDYIPLRRLPARYSGSQIREREAAIRAETDRRVSVAPPLGSAAEAREFRDRVYRSVVEEYDARNFDATTVDRSSVGFEGGIVSNVFASVRDDGRGGRVGCGYHGIIEPELLAAVPKEYVVEERGRPHVRRRDGKTVVDVQRWLIDATHGIGLMHDEEIVQGEQVASLEQEATRTIANAIVYKIGETSRVRTGYREDIHEPFYWSEVHWAYKKFVENRLPFLAKVAGVDPRPIASFVGEEAENEWMFRRILSSGVTSAKQLDDKRSYFALTIDDVFVNHADRDALHAAEQQYPEAMVLRGHPFPIAYEWRPDGRALARGIVEVERSSGYGNNATWLNGVVPGDVPVIGSKENPLPIVFRFRDIPLYGMREEQQDFPANRFVELLEILQPQERFLDNAWYVFSRNDAVGKMSIPLTVTARDTFPTPEQLRILMAPNPESVPFVVDRAGVTHVAYATLAYVEGDVFRIQYAKTLQDAEETLAHAKEKHAQRVAALRSREALGGDVVNEQLKNVRALQAELDRYTSEFEKDHLVAFVLGRPPLPEDDRRRMQSCLDENDIAHAETILKLRIRERKDAQPAIDAMRKVSSTIVELEKLGFDWRRYDYNKRNREFVSSRPDMNGFYSGDIRLHKNEIYLPSMGRVVGHRIDLWRLAQELPNLQRRLDREMEVLNMKKDALRSERLQQGMGPSDDESVPEVIHRGFVDDDGDED